jgi:CheY-like chemotaxis protein
MELLGRLTGGVAHDFNNLLTVILGNAELLGELASDPTHRQLADMTAAAAKRGAELTQKLLSFSRSQPLEPRALVLNRTLSDIHGLIQSTLAPTTDLQLNLAEDLWPCELDRSQFETALLNLVVNARDAMSNGGRLSIETFNATIESPWGTQGRDLPAGDYVQVAVSDTGIGMGPEVREHLFEPFFTTKGRGQVSGLGLSMVYGFVKQSGGGIHVYSEPGVGTTVRLLFPRAADQGARAIERTADEEDPIAGGSETILVVEDDGLVRTHVISMLQSLGYQVLQAEDGPEALRILNQTSHIQLLLTDIVMPGGMNGRELAELARALRPELSVLYTSGYTENALLRHGRLEAGVALLSKPYTPQDLARKIRSTLRGQAA